MEKYYTPVLEEFYIGFEYEILEDGNWTKEKFKIDVYLDEFFMSEKRVKYLDEADILELKWEKAQFVTEDHIVKNYKYGDFTLNHWSGSPFETGYYIEIWHEHQDNAFNGYIKNKNELKKLMTQIGIK